MEDLKMTPTQPLRFGDGQAYWACQQVMDKMAALLERMSTELPKEFKVRVSSGRDGRAYCYAVVALPNVTFDVGLIFGDEGEPNHPIWPVIHVRPEVPREGDAAAHAVERAKAHEILATQFNRLGPGWPGQSALPSHDEMSRFLGAWEWEQQVSEFLAIVRGWFEKLGGARIVERTSAP
jgi:hypothetical protein